METKRVSIWKSCWRFILALWIVIQVRWLIMLFLHPVGGGIFHEIYAYFGGRPDVAYKILKEYLIIDSAIVAILIVCNYPLNGVILSLMVSAIGTLSWWRICSFPYQAKGFHDFCCSYLGLIPAVIFSTGMITMLVKKIFRGEKNKKRC